MTEVRSLLTAVPAYPYTAEPTLNQVQGRLCCLALNTRRSSSWGAVKDGRSKGQSDRHHTFCLRTRIFQLDRESQAGLQPEEAAPEWQKRQSPEKRAAKAR
jgi:hypothetical protein